MTRPLSRTMAEAKEHKIPDTLLNTLVAIREDF
jgi:hypothetical protein